MIFKTGDIVRITCDDHTVSGRVALASSNGYSLILEFEAILDGHVGTMPVRRRVDDGSYRALLTNKPVLILPARLAKKSDHED